MAVLRRHGDLCVECHGCLLDSGAVLNSRRLQLNHLNCRIRISLDFSPCWSSALLPPQRTPPWYSTVMEKRRRKKDGRRGMAPPAIHRRHDGWSWSPAGAAVHRRMGQTAIFCATPCAWPQKSGAFRRRLLRGGTSAGAGPCCPPGRASCRPGRSTRRCSAACLPGESSPRCRNCSPASSGRSAPRSSARCRP